MASNRIPENYEPLVAHAQDAADGVAQLGAAVGLSQNAAPKLLDELHALIGNPQAHPPLPGKQTELAWAVAARTGAVAAERTVTSNARALVATGLGWLKNFLGRQWNSAWVAAGFLDRTLAVPDDPRVFLQRLGAYFGAHPEHENGALGVTAAGCTAQLDAVNQAHGASNRALAAMTAARVARDAAQTTVYARMKGLRSELTQLLGADDERWYAFGFDRPADGEEPGVLTGLVLTPGAAGCVVADWDGVRRAEHYHVWRQIVGQDPAPVPVEGTPHDTELVLSGLPSGAQVIVSVAGVNEAGDGRPELSAPFTVP